MAGRPPWELRLEIYADPTWDPALREKISAMLSQRWPVTWDVKVPPRPSLDHPARWHAVVLLTEGETPEGAHGQLVRGLAALDPGHGLRFRTRWDYPQSPNEQEIYEERWHPDRT